MLRCLITAISTFCIYFCLPFLIFSSDLFDAECVVELESVGLLTQVLSLCFELANEQLRPDCFVCGLLFAWNDSVSAPFWVYGGQVKILVLNILVIFVNQLFGHLFVLLSVFLW